MIEITSGSAAQSLQALIYKIFKGDNSGIVFLRHFARNKSDFPKRLDAETVKNSLRSCVGIGFLTN
jgi:hypothetical protein